ncbi:YbaN family protein [Brachyspira pulli]|uniref:YbaN family protein n=1 Tax=Brachyspira pulli TaxID=310721 RepID=UPI003004E95F
MRIIFLCLAFIFMAIGIVGVVIPILPTAPFLLVAAFFFAKGSEKFHNWFISTKLYKKHLESFVQSKSMTLKSKLSILIPVSIMLIIAFIFVNNFHARIVLVVLLIAKYLYFFICIKTIKEYDNNIKTTNIELDE